MVLLVSYRASTRELAAIFRSTTASGGRLRDKVSLGFGQSADLEYLYRTYQHRRSKEGRNLTSSDRWTEGMRARKLLEAGKDQHAGVNDSGELSSAL
jgi:hypothetical protein